LPASAFFLDIHRHRHLVCVRQRRPGTPARRLAWS
jgi:hypothetical protein